jgi:hypothetical protein
MTAPDTTFSLGLTYWPRGSGYALWEHTDRAALRDELAHIADLGCNTLRVCLTWEEFQPAARQIGSRALRALEQLLDAAQDAGLGVVPVLFPVASAGVLALPAWANGASLLDELTGAGGLMPTLVVPVPGAAVLYDGSYHSNQARDLFSYRPMLAAQRYQIDEVVGYFGAHPAIWAWQLGDGLERAHRPASAEAVAAWYAGMADAVRERRAAAKVLGVTMRRGLGLRAGPRPEQIVASCDLLGVSADPPEPPGEARRHTSYAAFLYALASGLAGRPAIVTALGMPTTGVRGGEWVSEQIFGRARPYFYADVEQQAGFLNAALERLYSAGAAGAWLAGYADYPAEQWARPPLDRTPRQRTLGLVDAQGREKPAAAAVREFAAQLRRDGGAIRDAALQGVDPERHWHDPARHMDELWAGFEGER